MSQKDNFFTKNKDLINVAGHSINALQNAQVRDNQRELAKLTLINQSLQEESLKNDQKKLELIDQQNQRLQKQEIETKQNAFIKKIMLGAVPELEDLVATVQKSSNAEKKTSLYLEAKYLLRFLKNYRQLIEDLQFQQLLHSAEKDLKTLEELDKETLNELCIQKIQEETDYLKALEILIMDEKKYTSLDPEEIDRAEEVLHQVYNDPTRPSILSEALVHIDGEAFSSGSVLEDSFVEFVLRVNDKINNYDFFISDITYKVGYIKYKIEYNLTKKVDNHLKTFSSKDETYAAVINPENFKEVDHGLIFSSAVHIKKLIGSINEVNKEAYEKDIGYIDSYRIKEYLTHIWFIDKENRFGNKDEFTDTIIALAGDTLNSNRESILSDYFYYIRDNFQGTSLLPEGRGGYMYGKYDKEYRRLGYASKDGCFVVTATTGSPNNQVVDDYRLYRDSYLQEKLWGRAFIYIYYKVGPYLAEHIQSRPSVKKYVLNNFILPLHKRIKKGF